MPAKIETKLTTKATAIEPGQPSEVALQSNYLYGAPGADLLVKATLTIEQDSDPFADALPGLPLRPGGREGRAPGRDLGRHHHRCQGPGELRHDADDLPDTPQPLKATLRTEVYEFGGRPVIKTLTLPVRNKPIFLGIKPLFADDAVASGVDAGFEIIAVNKAGAMAAANGVQYRLVPEDWDYQWFYQGLRIGTTRSSPATSRPWRRASWI